MNIFKTAMVAALTVSGFAMAPAAYAQDHMAGHDAPVAAEHGMGDMHHDRGMHHGRHHARHCMMRHHHRVCR